MTTALFVLAGMAAVGDWWAMWQRFFRIEYALKPLTMLLLIAATATADLPVVKVWVLAALVLGLVGDVALMLSAEQADRPDGAFLIGLGTFLAGHVCYLVAFTRFGLGGVQLVAGLLVVVGAAALTLPRVLAGARRAGGQELMGVVAGYAAVLAATAAFAVGTGAVLTGVGGLLFLASDSMLAEDRFVRQRRHAPLLVIVTYHLAQGLMVLGLIAAS